eukprot:1903513-Amphidinium_carterae.1
MQHCMVQAFTEAFGVLMDSNFAAACWLERFDGLLSDALCRTSHRSLAASWNVPGFLYRTNSTHHDTNHAGVAHY